MQKCELLLGGEHTHPAKNFEIVSIPDNLVLKVETLLHPGEGGIKSDKQS